LQPGTIIYDACIHCLQVLASSPLVLQHLEACGPSKAAAAAAATRQRQASADQPPPPAPISTRQLAHWISALTAAGRGALAAVAAAAWPASADAAASDAVALAFTAEGRLTQQLLKCLRSLQPRSTSAGPPSGSAVDPSGVRAALTLHVPADDLQWGSQHDSAEALEVRVRGTHGRAWDCRTHAMCACAYTACMHCVRVHVLCACAVCMFICGVHAYLLIGRLTPFLTPPASAKPHALQALCNAVELEQHCHSQLHPAPRRPPGLEQLVGASTYAAAGVWGSDGRSSSTSNRGAGAGRDEGLSTGQAAAAASVTSSSSRGNRHPLKGFLSDEITCLSCSTRWGAVGKTDWRGALAAF